MKSRYCIFMLLFPWNSHHVMSHGVGCHCNAEELTVISREIFHCAHVMNQFVITTLVNSASTLPFICSKVAATTVLLLLSRIESVAFHMRPTITNLNSLGSHSVLETVPSNPSFFLLQNTSQTQPTSQIQSSPLGFCTPRTFLSHHLSPASSLYNSHQLNATPQQSTHPDIAFSFPNTFILQQPSSSLSPHTPQPHSLINPPACHTLCQPPLFT